MYLSFVLSPELVWSDFSSRVSWWNYFRTATEMMVTSSWSIPENGTLFGGCFNYVLFTLLVREGWGWSNTWHWTDEIDSSLSVTHTLGGEDIACHTGPHGGCTWGQREPPGAVVGRLCSIKRMRWPLVSRGGCDWLVWLIPHIGKELKSSTQG